MSCVVALIGCSSSKWKKPDFSSILPPGPPSQIVAIWEPAVEHTAGETKPIRGFGGRVFFYENGGKKPVKINGNVVVYAFDEDERQPDDNAPSRSYVFVASDVKKLYAKSKLGHSYNFWVPWDKEGMNGDVKKISLIVRYVPEKGPSAVSSQAMVYLPGKSGQSELLAKTEWDARSKREATARELALRNRGPAPLNEMVIESNDDFALAMQTTTISLPETIARNMQKLPPQAIPTSPILPAGFTQEGTEKAEQKIGAVVEKETEKVEEPKSLTKSDPMGRGVHSLEDRKPNLERRPTNVVVDERGLIRAQ